MIYIYIYIYVLHIIFRIDPGDRGARDPRHRAGRGDRDHDPGAPAAGAGLGGGDDTVGDPRRAQISQFELFELKFLDSSFSSLPSC